MEGKQMNVREELDDIFGCLRVAEERLDRALEAVNGREVKSECTGNECCGEISREPGIMDRLALVGKRAASVATKAETLADSL